MTLSTHKENFSWGWFTLQRFRPLSSWKEAWWNMGRHGVLHLDEQAAGRRGVNESGLSF